MSSIKNGVCFIGYLSSSGGTSGGGKSKARKRNSSDSPSALATNEHGCNVVSDRLRSVLSHPLGLSLMYALNGMDLSKLKCLAMQQNKIDNIKSLNNFLLASVKQWRTMNGRKTEDRLMKEITGRVNGLSQKLGYFAHSEVSLYDEQDNKTNPLCIDFLLSPLKDKVPGIESEKSTPYAVIEFGLHGMNWSKKLDQNVKYMDKMVRGELTNRSLSFKLPILCGVVTIEDKDNVFDFKIGVFLCSRRDLDDPHDQFRMSLLWNARTNELNKASTLFGRLLQVTNDFKSWITDIDGFSTRNKYQYLSSNCCRCTINHGSIEDGGAADGPQCLPGSEPREQSDGERLLVVLRSYDNCVRKSL